MRERIARTVLSLLAVAAAVLAFRWTVRTAMSRAYRAEREVRPMETPVLPAEKVHDLARIVPAELHVNIAGFAIRRSAERLHMPYALAVDVAAERAAGAGWERLDDENAVTLKNISGMERVYRTPEGSIVLREVRAVVGDDSLMEDFTIPAELIPEHTEQTTPDALARRSAHQVKSMMPGVLRDVVAGSPLMTELIERGGGAAFIVHCVAETAAAETARTIEAAARRAGWTESPFDPAGAGGPLSRAAENAADARESAPPVKSAWTKKNLTFYFEVVPRVQGGGCDVDYRFTDDEAYILTKGKANED